MSDIFHKEIPTTFINSVFDTMDNADWHIFQVLTKRSPRMRDYLRQRYGVVGAPEHIWCGVSVEDGEETARLSHLRSAPAKVRFLSIEPLLGPVGRLNLAGLAWVIVGGESGPRARPLNPDWVRELRDQCVSQEVPFFFKQWGGIRPKAGGRKLDGREWSQFPQSTLRASSAG